MEGRYYFGYSDVLRNGTKYQGNPTHSPLDNINISLAFYYRLSKEGIRSAPSRGVAQRMLEAEEKRASRRMKRNGNDTLPSMETTTDSLPDMESVTEPQLESESSEIGETDRPEGDDDALKQQEKEKKKDRRKASKKEPAIESETIKTEEDGGSDRIDSPAEDRPADSTGY